jgi:hypothetical protein
MKAMIFTRFIRPTNNDVMVLKRFCVRVRGWVSSFTKGWTVYIRTVCRELNGVQFQPDKKLERLLYPYFFC